MERYSNTILFQSGASPVTANGQSNGFDVSRFSEGLLLINITAMSGTTPSLTVFVETLDPVTNTWFPHSATGGKNGTQYTAVDKYVIPITNFGQQIRLRWTVGGTGASITFSAVFVAKS